MNVFSSVPHGPLKGPMGELVQRPIAAPKEPTMDIPIRLLETETLAPDTHLIRILGGEGVSPVAIHLNSMVITGREPIVVDTGAGVARDMWFEAVEAVVDPADVRWIFLSHDDPDHTGNLLEMLDRAPQRHARDQLVHRRAPVGVVPAAHGPHALGERGRELPRRRPRAARRPARPPTTAPRPAACSTRPRASTGPATASAPPSPTRSATSPSSTPASSARGSCTSSAWSAPGTAGSTPSASGGTST